MSKVREIRYTLDSGEVMPGVKKSLIFRPEGQQFRTKHMSVRAKGTFSLMQVFINNHKCLAADVPLEVIEHLDAHHFETCAKGTDYRLDVLNVGSESGRVVFLIRGLEETAEPEEEPHE
jgi:hypothetical protein